MKRIDDINELNPQMKEKVEKLLQLAKENGLNVKVFETYRSQERQDELYAQGRTKPGRKVTWTRNSRHKKREAVDMVFIDKNGNYTWSGDWNKLIDLGKECKLYSLAPLEKAHFQDNGEALYPIPDWAEPTVQKMKEKGIKTDPSEEVGRLPLYQLLMIIDKYNDNK